MAIGLYHRATRAEAPSMAIVGRGAELEAVRRFLADRSLSDLS